MGDTVSSLTPTIQEKGLFDLNEISNERFVLVLRQQQRQYAHEPLRWGVA